MSKLQHTMPISRYLTLGTCIGKIYEAGLFPRYLLYVLDAYDSKKIQFSFPCTLHKFRGIHSLPSSKT